MIIDNEFEIGETVFLKTDPDQLPHIIIAIHVFAKGEIMYKTMQASYDTTHYPFEMTREKIIVD